MSSQTTFLDLTNRTLQRLREEAVTTLPTYGDRTSNPRTSIVMDFVNEATHEILYDYHWPFNWSTGVTIPYYAPIRGENALVANGFSTVSTSPPLTQDEVDRITNPPSEWSFTVENDSVLESQSYFIRTASTTNPSITLETVYRGEEVKNDATWMAYNNRFAFAAENGFSPQSIISVTDQNRPLTLSFSDRPDPFDVNVARQQQSMGRPTHVMVSTSSSQLGGTNNAMEMLIYPVPDQDGVLSIIYQPTFPDNAGQIRMENAGDTLHAVPERVLTLIVELAYTKALESDVQNDPERAAYFRALLNRNLANANRRATSMPMAPKSNKPFDQRARANRTVRQQWARQEVRKL